MFKLSFIIYRACLYIGGMGFLLGLALNDTIFTRIGFGMLLLSIIFKLDIKR